MVRLRTPLVLTLAAALAVPLAAAPAAVEASAAVAESFVFTPCNRTYRRAGTELAPITRGALTLTLSSPDNRLTLEEHELLLTPLDDGTHRAVFTARFAGSGELVMDVDAGGAVSRLEDTVTVPRQERTVEGRVRLARRETAGEGPPVYEVTTVELPETVEIDVDSALAGRVAALCQGLALVLGLNCSGLGDALSRARVDLPEPGETYLLPAECVEEQTRRRLDSYLRDTYLRAADLGAGGGS